MIDLLALPDMVEDRQAYLRSLAKHQPPGRDAGSARQLIGRMLVRFGRWVEGCRPEVVAEPPVTGSYRSV